MAPPRPPMATRASKAWTSFPTKSRCTRKIASKSSHTVKLGKEGFYRQAEMSLARAYEYVSEVMVENLMARDAEEGLKAFIDKREPKWEDR